MLRTFPGWVALGVVLMAVACASPEDPTTSGADFAGPPVDEPNPEEPPPSDPTGEPVQTISLATNCPAYGPDVYTPFADLSSVSTASVATLPWRGKSSSYPDTSEDFRAYAVPDTVECSNNRGERDYVDVTSGCLDAAMFGGDKVGKIHGTSDGYYRSFALPYDSAANRQVAWGDQGVEYRFNYSAWTNNVSGPGFKAFVRYLTEYDLYVASWREDGVVQIQKKQCGEYTVLKRNNTYGAPSKNTWHTIRFEVKGSELRLYLDGTFAMSATDDSITHGTAGIRIDSAENSYIDNWRVYAP